MGEYRDSTWVGLSMINTLSQVPPASAWSVTCADPSTHTARLKTIRYKDTAHNRAPDGGWGHPTRAPGKELDKQLLANLESPWRRATRPTLICSCSWGLPESCHNKHMHS